MVRQRSAKPLFIGSIPIVAFFALSKIFKKKGKENSAKLKRETFERSRIKNILNGPPSQNIFIYCFGETQFALKIYVHFRFINFVLIGQVVEWHTRRT